jgi:hypothetical protein
VRVAGTGSFRGRAAAGGAGGLVAFLGEDERVVIADRLRDPAISLRSTAR